MQHRKEPSQSPPGQTSRPATTTVSHATGALTNPPAHTSLSGLSRTAIARDIKNLEQELEARRHSPRPLRRSVLMAYAVALSQRQQRLDELTSAHFSNQLD